MIPISWYLILSAGLFCIGLFGVLARKNAIAILMGVELMLNAVNINLIAFWHFHTQLQRASQMSGLVFAAIVFIVAAAEVAIGLALVISTYRRRRTVIAEEMNLLKG
jgi:NADH:ubiquinone oxidoreductase subunit K